MGPREAARASGCPHSPAGVAVAVLYDQSVSLLTEDRFPTIWMPSTELRDLRALLLHRSPDVARGQTISGGRELVVWRGSAWLQVTDATLSQAHRLAPRHFPVPDVP